MDALLNKPPPRAGKCSPMDGCGSPLFSSPPSPVSMDGLPTASEMAFPASEEELNDFLGDALGNGDGSVMDGSTITELLEALTPSSSAYAHRIEGS